MLTTNQSNPHRPRVLPADDQPDVLEALRLLLKSEGFVAETVNSPAGVIRLLSASRDRQFDLMLMDLNSTRDTTSGSEGLALIEEVRKLDDTLPVIVMTAWGSIELAVEAMREGGCSTWCARSSSAGSGSGASGGSGWTRNDANASSWKRRAAFRRACCPPACRRSKG